MDDGGCAPLLTRLVEQHYALLYRYAYRLTGSAADAEDLVQQSFLTAHRKIDQLREPENGKAWLFTIARNAFLKNKRSRPAATTFSLENTPEPRQACPPDTGFDYEQLQTVLNEMDEEFRTPLILFYFEQFSYKDIAAQMDVPIGTVMSRLARGKSYLRQRLASFQPAGSRPD